MNLPPPLLPVRLEAARATLEHLRNQTSLPLELQLAIATTLYEIERLRLQIDAAARPH